VFFSRHQRTALGGLTGVLVGLATSAGAEPASFPDAEATDTVTVTGQRAREAEATKDNVPLLENPQALSVVPAAVIEEQGLTRLADALRGVAGISRSSSYGFYDAYQIRGYDAAYGSVYLDGLISTNVAGASNELAGLEQVEVLKGPASMLFGSAPLGGIVNLVSKRPQAARFANVALSTGSYDLREATLDANAPLTSSDVLLGRLNLVYRDSGDFVDLASRNRLYVAPSLTWNIAERTKLTLLTRYERNHDSPWGPLTAWGTVLPSAHGDLPVSFSISGAGDQRAVQDQWAKQVGYVFEHAFSDNFTFSQTARYSHNKVFWNNWIFVGGFVDNDIVDGVQQGHVLGRYTYGPFRQTDEDLAVDSRARLTLTTGVVEHGLLFGVDYRRNRSAYAEDGGNYDGPQNPLDILAPDRNWNFVHDPAQAYGDSGNARQTGFYLQDHLRFGDAFTLTFGGRWDRADSDGEIDEKFSPRVGVTRHIAPDTSLYASWSRSFTPQPGLFTVAGDALTPETGENFEVGLKLAPQGGILSGAIALFQLTRQNVATEDPANPFFYVITGEQRSRGAEVEGVWRVTPALALSLAYTYLDAVVTEDNLFQVGARLANVPKHGAYLAGDYNVQGGPMRGLDLRVGYLYNSRKNATLSPEDLDFDGAYDPVSLFTLPGYSLLDVGATYPLRSWSLRLNVNNVLDKRYFPDACCVDRVTPGEGRSFRVTAAKSF
jgi:iron complex outermembrane receptor protein